MERSGDSRFYETTAKFRILREHRNRSRASAPEFEKSPITPRSKPVRGDSLGLRFRVAVQALRHPAEIARTVVKPCIHRVKGVLEGSGARGAPFRSGSRSSSMSVSCPFPFPNSNFQNTSSGSLRCGHQQPGFRVVPGIPAIGCSRLRRWLRERHTGRRCLFASREFACAGVFWCLPCHFDPPDCSAHEGLFPDHRAAHARPLPHHNRCI